ncbi:MAG: gliding motility protein GldM [Chitinophagia bacterium]|nr:gliding motility protein GldM [Chitinophagia bacterium]
MAGVNETPRQKMMGILYLVLLGLAATTITQQVLDAFRNLTIGLESSTNNVESTISQTFAAFEAGKLKTDPTRAKPFWDRANRVKAAVDELNKYIEDTKRIFQSECGGIEEETGDYKNREDVDISPRIMINKKRADTLRTLINTTRDKILAELDSNQRRNFKMALNADDPKTRKGDVHRTWAQNYFGDGIPLTAAVTALTKIGADLKSTESEAIKAILGSVDQTQIVMDDFAAVAVPTSPTYVLLGQQYKAEVFLTAYSKTQNPEISVNGQTLSVENGKGIYTATASREGEFKWSAKIHVKKADGTYSDYETQEMMYRAAKPSAVVSPDMMNVFYIGVDNPVSISAPGSAKESLKPSINNGSITGSNGAYVVRVTNAGKALVSVFGSDASGKSVKLGETEFRVKRLPTPKAKFGGKSGGPVPKAQLTSTDKVFANLDDFDFKAQFTVNHFKLYIIKPRQDPMAFELNGNILNAQMKGALASITPGTRVIFDEVFATGPDGVRRPLDPMIFTVQ